MHAVQPACLRAMDLTAAFARGMGDEWVAMLMNDPTPSSVKKVQDRFAETCAGVLVSLILKAMSSFAQSEEKGPRKEHDESKVSGDTSSERRKHPEPEMAEYDPEAQRVVSQAPCPTNCGVSGLPCV